MIDYCELYLVRQDHIAHYDVSGLWCLDGCSRDVGMTPRDKYSISTLDCTLGNAEQPPSFPPPSPQMNIDRQGKKKRMNKQI